MANHPNNNNNSPYRAYLPDLTLDRFKNMQKQNPYEYADAFKSSGRPPWLHALYCHWKTLLSEPFKGITNDGEVRPGLFTLQDQGIPIEDIVKAAKFAVSKMSAEQKSRCFHHIDSPEWRTWSNPEFLLSDKGVRLDEVSEELRDAIMEVLRATLSPEGYDKAISAMRINGFLGELVQSPAVMNEYSYNFVVFGSEPSTMEPWGFSFYGHHLCLNVLLYKTQVVIAPCFTGAEPNIIDAGRYEGTRILVEEERLGLGLMQSLPGEMQSLARVFQQMKDPLMPHGRWNHDDQRHLCGAYRDNRVVPYEGVLVGDLSSSQQDTVTAIISEFLLYLPAKARGMRVEEAKRWYCETYFCWIGGFGDADAFYYRIQSPVVVVEFDHHSGVFLDNEEPRKFHIHTILRGPNGGDYGMALRRLIPGKPQEFVWEGE